MTKECAKGYAKGFNDACKPANDKYKLRKIIAAAYQIAGAYDAPAYVLDVLADPLGATQAQIDALLPFVQPVQELIHAVKSNGRHSPLLTHMMNKRNTLPLPVQEPLTGELYNALLFAVSNKYPNETRHQTALRYIKEAETCHAQLAKAHNIGGAKP